VTLKVIFALYDLSVSHNSGNTARIISVCSRVAGRPLRWTIAQVMWT